MQIPILTLPRAVPEQKMRPPQDTIPQTREERDAVKRLCEKYVESDKPVPPLSLEELRKHAESLIARNNLDAKFRDYVAVLLNSEVWREQLATVPFERRLLLLPKCLRVEDKCPAPFDEFGLLCKQRGLCSIQDLQVEAERLGYAVLVAEGSAIVMAIIGTGKIDAIVGVSCLSVLEKAFPYMESAAIPGVAIPLLQDDCVDTNIDLDWVWDVIHLSSDDQTRRLDLDGLRREVEGWFEQSELNKVMGLPSGESERISREWLGKSGKRWRPFLAACAYKAMQSDPNAPLPEDFRKVAIAVECFHKASLVHDDIEDNDSLRYGEKTLHEEYGVPVALNVGDLLLGEGYRLIGECEVDATARGAMLKIAAAGHRTLCLGQGAELCWVRKPQQLSSLQVLDIFRQKTAPAFEVALRLGAAYAGHHDDQDLSEILSAYSEALGIAYQIRDDIEDLAEEAECGDINALRPTLPLALAAERTKDENQKLVQKFWKREPSNGDSKHLRELLAELQVADRCRGLLDAYKEQAIRSLADLENASLKGLLRRVISKIFTVEVKGWCSEFETRNAASRAALAETAG
jgi:geranylgeranyl diphosphate synthase, type II